MATADRSLLDNILRRSPKIANSQATPAALEAAGLYRQIQELAPRFPGSLPAYSTRTLANVLSERKGYKPDRIPEYLVDLLMGDSAGLIDVYFSGSDSPDKLALSSHPWEGIEFVFNERSFRYDSAFVNKLRLPQLTYPEGSSHEPNQGVFTNVLMAIRDDLTAGRQGWVDNARLMRQAYADTMQSSFDAGQMPMAWAGAVIEQMTTVYPDKSFLVVGRVPNTLDGEDPNTLRLYTTLPITPERYREIAVSPPLHMVGEYGGKFEIDINAGVGQILINSREGLAVTLETYHPIWSRSKGVDTVSNRSGRRSSAWLEEDFERFLAGEPRPDLGLQMQLGAPIVRVQDVLLSANPDNFGGIKIFDDFPKAGKAPK